MKRNIIPDILNVRWTKAIYNKRQLSSDEMCIHMIRKIETNPRHKRYVYCNKRPVVDIISESCSTNKDIFRHNNAIFNVRHL